MHGAGITPPPPGFPYRYLPVLAGQPAPRTSRTEAERHIDQLLAGPLPADVHRLVHA
ncbi:hypothetical protein [Streptomyces sp. Ru62]|uniref:hypothetical protein n=1 Tax=Streptomyces sp. Ru62 TaxID=2080745 RepID=UPI0015E43304|nr:hypothetical protein [Streptomyces sp. Ru62]